MSKIVQVMVNIPTKTITKPFSYSLPEQLGYVVAGWRVLVPFGNRKLEGFVIGMEDGPIEGLKEVIEVLDDHPWFDKNMFQTAHWISGYYLCSLAEALRLFIPGKTGIKTFVEYRAGSDNNYDYVASLLAKKSEHYLALFKYIADYGPLSIQQILRKFSTDNTKELSYLVSKNIIIKEYRANKQGRAKYETIFSLGMPHEEAQKFIQKSGKAAQQRIVAALLCKSELTGDDLKELKISPDTIKRAVASGLIVAEKKRVIRDSYACIDVKNANIDLNDLQKNVLAKILPFTQKRQYQSFLLRGITGSGKTQVYLETVAQIRRLGRQAIVLVPEIALTSQIVARFKARFGNDVVVMHSKLTLNERNDAIVRLKTGQAGIVIGARSAIFAPIDDLGAIIIDEEHEFTYKQEESPRYHAREVAFRRAELANAVVVLGSATPSIETYFGAIQGKHTLLEMLDRVDGAKLPTIDLVDMREELRIGRRNVISLPLQNLIRGTIERGEQVIILLNRRGHSTFVMCRECGHVMCCEQCAVSLVYHKSGMLRCHYCQSSASSPDVCPCCSSRYIRYFGTGTQKLEEELLKIYPDARIIRMDQDTTGGKLSHDRILEAFSRGEYDILLGTQMVAKGHDIKNVTAVGIITADSILNLPDFRAAERAFSLITQAAGRAGRGDIGGRAIIQTYSPEHYAIEEGAKQSYIGFYEKEISFRKALFYPPFSKILKITVTATNETDVHRKAESVTSEIRSALKGEDNLQILGPFVAPIAKINNIFRMNILIKALGTDNIKKQLISLELHTRADISIDIDPLNVM
ncbi:primosomal protein N' [Dendrosporobacter sp. 1207_IL3150]|uniref:primosomal protein N' n=1 Tax=Dendrosporobacter sp. 1207_IL3150 TaxID=3084054 RepID=UPI002FDACEC9